MGTICTTANLGDVVFNKEYQGYNQNKESKDQSSQIEGQVVNFNNNLPDGCMDIDSDAATAAA